MYIILLWLLSFFLLPGNSSISSAVYPGDHWEMKTPEEMGMSSSALMDAVSYLKEHSGKDGIEELAVVRSGYLVFAGDSVNKVHRVWSMTKSFTGTMLGLLIGQGKCNLNTYASTYVPELANHYPDVTLRHFATMTSGYRAVGDEPQGDYRHGPSRTPFLPGPVPLFRAGTNFAYWDSAMNELAYILTIIAGESLEQLFSEKIAAHIGLGEHEWRWGDLGSYSGVRINGGAGNHVSMEISSLGMARFGYLFLRMGDWKEHQLIDSSWIEQSTAVQVPADVPFAGYVDQGPGTYGYNWWVNGKGPDGKRKWPDLPGDTYSASGYNNNDMFVIPGWDMVVVRLGLDQNDHLITDDEYNRFLFLIGRSLGK